MPEATSRSLKMREAEPVLAITLATALLRSAFAFACLGEDAQPVKASVVMIAQRVPTEAKEWFRCMAIVVSDDCRATLNLSLAGRLQIGEHLGFGVHDRFVDLGGFGSEAGDAHEITFAGGGEGGLADLGEFVAEAFDLFRSDLGHIVTGLGFSVLMLPFGSNGGQTNCTLKKAISGCGRLFF